MSDMTYMTPEERDRALIEARKRKERRDEYYSQFDPNKPEATINFLDCVEEPPQLDFVFGSVVAGTVGSIIAPGSTGKGFFCLGVGFDLVLGRNVLGMDIEKITPEQKVAMITLEDQADVMTVRSHNMLVHHGLVRDGRVVSRDAQRDVEALSKQFTLKSIQPIDLLDLVESDGKVNWEAAEMLAKHYKGYRLIILDTLSRLHGANESDNPHMRALIGAFEFIAHQTGAAICFTHHASKSATKGGDALEAIASRGAATLTDNVRAQLNLVKVTQEDLEDMVTSSGSPIPKENANKYIRMYDPKSNNKETKGLIWLERGYGGCLKRADFGTSTGWDDNKESAECQQPQSKYAG